MQVPAATGDGHVEIAAGDVSWEVEGSGATLHCSGFAPLTAVAVDGETGAPIPGLASQAASHLAAGPERVARFEVQAPDGYVEALRGPQEVTAHVSRWAREVRVVAPLRREADIRVRVVNAAGEPAPGATVAAVYLAGPEPQFIPSDELPEVVLVEDVPEEVVEGEGSGAIRHTSAPADDDGWIRVRGAPHLLDEHYWIVAGDEEHGGFAGITLGSFGERYEREIRLPEAPVSAWQDWGYSCRIGFG